MKMITRDTDYAIRAVACAASSEKGVVTVKELSKKLDMPGPFLRKIFQILNKKGIMISYKGRSGGFSLARSPEKITILDMVEIFQGPFHISEHLFKGKVCPMVNTCVLKRKLNEMEKDIIKGLKEVTIKDLSENFETEH